ncbi:hypothetical protein V8E53_013846 [Lactarius tabidus]
MTLERRVNIDMRLTSISLLIVGASLRVNSTFVITSTSGIESNLKRERVRGKGASGVKEQGSGEVGFFGFGCGFLWVVWVHKPTQVTVMGTPMNNDRNQYFYSLDGIPVAGKLIFLTGHLIS